MVSRLVHADKSSRRKIVLQLLIEIKTDERGFVQSFKRIECNIVTTYIYSCHYADTFFNITLIIYFCLHSIHHYCCLNSITFCHILFLILTHTSLCIDSHLVVACVILIFFLIHISLALLEGA